MSSGDQQVGDGRDKRGRSWLAEGRSRLDVEIEA